MPPSWSKLLSIWSQLRLHIPSKTHGTRAASRTWKSWQMKPHQSGGDFHFSIWAVTAAVTSNPCRTSPLLRWLLRSPPKAPIQQAPPPGIAVFHFPSRLHGSTDESTKIYQAEACWKVALPHTSSLCEMFSTEQFSWHSLQFRVVQPPEIHRAFGVRCKSRNDHCTGPVWPRCCCVHCAGEQTAVIPHARHQWILRWISSAGAMLWNGKAWLLDLLDVIEAANGIGICGLHWPTIHSFILSLSLTHIYIYIIYNIL